MPAGLRDSWSTNCHRTPGSRSKHAKASSSRRPPKKGCPRQWISWVSTSRGCRTKRDMPERALRTAERTTRTILAFDFGLKRIGVAVGEPELRTAHPLPAIAAPGFAGIEKLVHEWKPAGLVVGLPVAERGEHALARRVERFARQLEGRFKLPVARVDERFTSVEAESRLRGLKKKAIDSVAAQLILEQYFGETSASAS